MAQATVYSSGGQQQQQGGPPPVKKPRTYPYRDGQSQAAQHYDLFEMIRHPHLAKEYRPPDPPPAPKYNSKQEQIEAGLARKFASSSQAGVLFSFIKGLMFLMFVPFYLLFIALPHWIYTTVANYIFKIKQAVQRKIAAVKQFFIRCYHNVVDPFKKLWKRMRDQENNQGSLDLGDEDLGFFAFIALGVYYAYSGLVRPVLRGIRGAYRGGVFGYKWLKSRPKKIQEAYHKKTAPFRRFKNQLAAYPRTLLKKFSIRFTEAVVRPVQSKFAGYREKMRASCKRLFKGTVGLVKAIKDTLLTPVASFNRVMQGIIASFQRKVEQFKEGVRRFIQHPAGYFRTIQIKLAASFTALKGKIPRFRLHISCANKVKAWSKNIKLQLGKLLFFTLPPRPKFLSFNMPKVNLSPRHLDNLMKAAVYKALVIAVQWLSIKLAPVKHRISSISEAMMRPYRIFRQKVQTRLAQLKQKLNRFFRPIRRFAHRRLLRIRLFIGWIRVLSRYSLRTLRARWE